MKITKNKIYLLVCLFGIVSCTGKKAKDSNVLFPEIGLDGFVKAEIPVTDLFEDYSLIPLETTDSCLIGGWTNKIIKKCGHIFVQSINEVLMYDYTGHFEGKLSRVGSGPQEYGEIYDFDIVPKYNEIWASYRKTIYCYKLPTMEYNGTIPLSFYANKIKYIDDDTFIALTPDDKVFNICSIDGKVLESYLDKDLANSAEQTVQFVKIDDNIVSQLFNANSVACYDVETRSFSMKDILSPGKGKFITREINRKYYDQYGYFDFGKKAMEDYASIIGFRKIGDTALMSVRYPGPENSIIISDGEESKQYKVYPEDVCVVTNDITGSGDISFMLSFCNSESDDSFLFMIPNENPDMNPSLLEVKEFK